MTDVAHKDLPNDQLHEPKGVDTASSGQVYVADGSGSGAWTTLTAGTFTVTYRVYTTVGNNSWSKPANLIGVEYILIGGGGGASTSGGGSGGDTTFNGAIAGGGERGTNSAGSGGTATGGDANFAGTTGLKGDISLADTPAPYTLGTYGTGRGALSSSSFSGGSGGVCLGWFDAADLSASETIAVGVAGTGAKSGAQGVALIKEYIKA